MQLGKVIGGGLPVGAYGGRKDIMQMVAPAGETCLLSAIVQSTARMALFRPYSVCTATCTTFM